LCVSDSECRFEHSFSIRIQAESSLAFAEISPDEACISTLRRGVSSVEPAGAIGNCMMTASPLPAFSARIDPP
jgi:hypothetical protein